MTELEKKVLANPRYHELIRRRTPYGWFMIAIMLVVYYGYIFLVAFDKAFMSSPIAPGLVTTWGMPIGVGVIVITIVLTAVYVRRANAEFDPLVEDIVREARR